MDPLALGVLAAASMMLLTGGWTVFRDSARSKIIRTIAFLQAIMGAAMAGIVLAILFE